MTSNLTRSFSPPTLLMKFHPLLLVAVSLASAGEIQAQPSADSSVKLNLTSPLEYQVFQRQTKTQGELIISGSIALTSPETRPPEKLEARIFGVPLTGKKRVEWQSLPFDARVAAFRGSLPVPAGGWYQVEVRAMRKGVTVGTALIEHVGIGEVFVIAGQSNSANHGEENQTTATGMVAAFTGTRWQLANDPQPGASGSGGSFLPAFGDALHARLKMPIGLVATGVGATSVREWLPHGTRIANPPTLTGHVLTTGPGQWEIDGSIFDNFVARIKALGPRGFHAVLWHQGESDANQRDAERTLSGRLYRDYMQQLIRESRQVIGWDVAWFVALASYHTPNDAASADIRSAQRSLWHQGRVLPGPDTDALTGDLRDSGGKGVHFSGEGLREHGRLWAELVGKWLEK